MPVSRYRQRIPASWLSIPDKSGAQAPLWPHFAPLLGIPQHDTCRRSIPAGEARVDSKSQCRYPPFGGRLLADHALAHESFPSHTGLTFDPVAAAESAADLTLRVLLDPARAARIVQYHMYVPGSPSLRVMLEQISATVAERPESGHSTSSEVERAVEFRALEAMLALAVNPAASSQMRAIARYHIKDLLNQWSSTPLPKDLAESIHRQAMIERIQQFQHDPDKFVPSKPVEAPPGMPIGDDDDVL